MSTELIAISGLGVTIISVGVALAALILNSQHNLRKEMQAEFKSVRVDINGLREEINGLREEFNSLRERMAHLEGLLEGLREAITGRRVAEDRGQYGPR